MTINGEAPTTADDERDRRSVEERRVQLIEAATEVIAEHGLTRATTRRITDHADLALGAFHYAFRSKDELLQAVIEHIAHRTETVLRESVVDPATGIVSTTEQMVSGYLAFARAEPDLQLAQSELTVHALREPKLRTLAAEQYDRYVEAMTAVFAQAPDAPDVEGQQDLARFLLATLDGLIFQDLLQGDDASASRRADLYLRCLAGVGSHAGDS